MRLNLTRLGLVFLAGLVGLAIVGPALATDGPVRVQVDTQEGESQGGRDAGGTPPPVAGTPSAKDVDHIDGTRATGGPNNDWELWLAIGLAITTTSAGMNSFRGKRNWDVAPQASAPPPAITPPQPTYETAEAQKIGRFAAFDPRSDPSFVDIRIPTKQATNTETARPALASSRLIDTNDPTKGWIRVYVDRTWEVTGPNGEPVLIDDSWQHTTTGPESIAKQGFRNAVGGLPLFVIGLPVSPAWGLFLALAGGVVADRLGSDLLPVPEAGQTDVTLYRVISCNDEPMGYSPLSESYIQHKVLRYQTFSFFIRSDGSTGLQQDWQNMTYDLSPLQDCGQWMGGEG